MVQAASEGCLDHFRRIRHGFGIGSAAIGTGYRYLVVLYGENGWRLHQRARKPSANPSAQWGLRPPKVQKILTFLGLTNFAPEGV